MILKIFSNRQWKEFKEIYCWSLKQRLGIMILYFALLFMAFPMITLLMLSSAQKYAVNVPLATQIAQTFSSALGGLSEILVLPLTLLFILILSVMLFNYMHQKRSVDYFHSLPAGRIPLLLGKYFAGLTMIFVPLILNFGILGIISIANNFGSAVPATSILYPLLRLMLMAAATFSFTVLMAVCSGTTMDMVISTIVINLAYPVMIVLCQLLATSILPGLNLGSHYMTLSTVAFAPFVAAFIRFFPIGYSGGYSSFTVWWIFLTLVMFAASLVLYRKRKSESAENTFAFPLPKIIIRFMATAAAGLGLGFVFIMIPGNNNPINFFLGLAIGSLITHIIAEAIYSRGFKTLKKSFVYYGAFVVLFLAAYIPLSFGCFGYDTRVPAAADIASAEISSNYNSMYDNSPVKVLDEQNNELANITGQLKSSENIENVRTLHQAIIDTYKQNSYPYKINMNRGEESNITYHLKNGHTITRSYIFYDILGHNSKVQEYSTKIVNTEEYKASSLLINYLEAPYIQEIRISSANKTGSAIDSGNDIKLEIINAVKQDIMSADSNAATTNG